MTRDIDYREFKIIWKFIHIVKDLDLSDVAYTYTSGQYYMAEPTYTIEIRLDLDI